MNEFKKHEQRFSGIGENYRKYRPDYTDLAIDFLFNELGLENGAVDKTTADIAAGTGLVSKRFAGLTRVFSVEPSDSMRAIFDETLKQMAADVADKDSIFSKNLLASKTIEGKSNHTNLPSDSVDFIVIGTAVHFLEPRTTLEEFCRIIKPGGKVAILQNWIDRQNSLSSKFVELYHSLYDMNWDRLGTFSAGELARAYIAPAINNKIELYDFVADKKIFIGWIKTFSESKDLSGEKEKIFLDFFEQNKVIENNIEVLKIGYKCEVYVGEPLSPELQKASDIFPSFQFQI